MKTPMMIPLLVLAATARACQVVGHRGDRNGYFADCSPATEWNGVVGPRSPAPPSDHGDVERLSRPVPHGSRAVRAGVNGESPEQRDRVGGGQRGGEGVRLVAGLFIREVSGDYGGVRVDRTGKPLHRAKAEALLGSLPACQSLETGLMLWEMLSAAEALEEKP